MMQRILITVVSALILFISGITLAQSPPFSLVTITGETATKFNRVSLFESGSAKEPLKTEYVSEFDGQYSIDVNIPDDMRKKEQYYVTDMRFWKDKNENGIKDSGEPVSECHFIIWVPAAEKIFMQIYKGSKHSIDSSVFYYHYNQ